MNNPAFCEFRCGEFSDNLIIRVHLLNELAVTVSRLGDIQVRRLVTGTINHGYFREVPSADPPVTDPWVMLDDRAGDSHAISLENALLDQLLCERINDDSGQPVLVCAILVDLDFETLANGTMSIMGHPHVSPGGKPFPESFCTPHRVHDLVVRIDCAIRGNPFDYEVSIIIHVPFNDGN